MSDEHPLKWPLSPSHAASVVHGLCMAMADLVNEEAGGETHRRAFLKMCGISAAAEVVSQELAHFFGSRMHEDETLLEMVEDRYLKRD